MRACWISNSDCIPLTSSPSTPTCPRRDLCHSSSSVLALLALLNYAAREPGRTESLLAIVGHAPRPLQPHPKLARGARRGGGGSGAESAGRAAHQYHKFGLVA
eukprot:3419464-Prymnesium_polylepis.1